MMLSACKIRMKVSPAVGLLGGTLTAEIPFLDAPNVLPNYKARGQTTTISAPVFPFAEHHILYPSTQRCRFICLLAQRRTAASENQNLIHNREDIGTLISSVTSNCSISIYFQSFICILSFYHLYFHQSSR